MQDFFKKHGVGVMTIRELFDFIVDPSITDETIDSYLEEVFPFPKLLLCWRGITALSHIILLLLFLNVIAGSTKNFGQRRCDFAWGWNCRLCFCAGKPASPYYALTATSVLLSKTIFFSWILSWVVIKRGLSLPPIGQLGLCFKSSLILLWYISRT